MPACVEPRRLPLASAGDWLEVFALLDTALELDVASHASWLEALAPAQARLAPLLKELLQVHADGSSAVFMRTPASFAIAALAPDQASAPAATPVGAAQALVGPYRLLHKIGQGGMASVWLAERADGLLERQVALKLPHVSWGIASFAERMARERNILASLTHPNIARLYDAGIADDGRPYLALEYIDGQPIDAYASARGLDTRQRVELIMQVARAVAHAHARLVVHRDLKPSNILVDAAGQAHLLDFGIAKLIDPLQGDASDGPQLTQAVGARALTPDYASPEQIRGEQIGTASDVYSLGVVAYELLAGAKPYRLKRQGAAALEAAIASVDVPLASAAAGSPGARRWLKGDLDAILNKALKKDLAERYPSVEAFAQDIERHLGQRPVQARPDSAGYRIRKLVGRNRLVVTAAAAVCVSLIAGLSVAMWQAREALAQTERAEQVKVFVLSIFADADTDSGAGKVTTAADLLKTARQRVSDEMAGRPELAVELMTAIGYSLIGQGLLADSATLMHEAVDLSSRQLGPQHVLTGAAQLVLGETLNALGRNKEAITVLVPGVESARRSGDLRMLGAGLRLLGQAQLDDEQIDVGVESTRQAVATVSAGGAGKAIGPRDAMHVHAAYANALNNAYRPGAVASARLALAAAREVYGPRVTQPVLELRAILALALVNEGQVAEGLREIDALLPATIELLGPRHPRVPRIARMVGGTKLNAGDVPGAIVALSFSMEGEDALGGTAAHFERGMARYLLARAHATARQPAVALPLLDEAVALLQVGAGPDNPLTLQASAVRAWPLAETGRLTEADREFATLESVQWTGSHQAAYQGLLALLRGHQGRHAQALELVERASQTLRTFPNKGVQAAVLTRLGIARLDAGDARQALEVLQEALALYAKAELGISPNHAEALAALGRSQLQLGDAAGAVRSLSAADGFWQAFDATNRRAGLAKLHLAHALWTQGDKLAATRALGQADAVLARSVFVADKALLQSTRKRISS